VFFDGLKNTNATDVVSTGKGDLGTIGKLENGLN